jgi:anti-sigma-K factor RskA
MWRYVVVAFVVAVVVLAIVFLLSEDETNMPFLYGLF